MATEEAKIKLTAEDKATKKIRDAEKAVDDLGGSTKKAESSAKDFGVAMAAAAVKIAALKAATIDAVGEFAKFEQTQGRLQRAIKRTGGSTTDMAKAMNIARTASSKGLGTMQDTIKALDVLTRQTGDFAIAQGDLALAQDIAETEGRNLLEVVELLRKARNGEVEELKNLNGINKDYAEQLNRVEDATVRGEKAVMALRDAYGGASEQLSGTQNKLDAAEDGFKRIQVAVGDLVVEIGDKSAGFINKLTSVFGLIEENQSLFDEFVLSVENLATGFSLAELKFGDMAGNYERIAIAAGAVGAGRSKEEARILASGLSPEVKAVLLSELAEKKTSGGGAPTTPTGRVAGSGGSGRTWGSQSGARFGGFGQGNFREMTGDLGVYDPNRQTPAPAEAKKKPRRRPPRQAAGLDPEISALVGSMSGANGTMDVAAEVDADRQARDEATAAAKRHLDVINRIRDVEQEELDRKREFIRLEEERVAAQELANAAVMEGAQFGVEAAQMAGATEAQISGIRGTMELAMALSETFGVTSLGIAPNPASAVAHYASAARYFAAAAMAPGGSKAKSGGGGGGGGSAISMANMERNRQQRDADQPRNVEITLDFTRSLIATPEGQREVATLVEKGMEQVLGGTSRIF